VKGTLVISEHHSPYESWYLRNKNSNLCLSPLSVYLMFTNELKISLVCFSEILFLWWFHAVLVFIFSLHHYHHPSKLKQLWFHSASFLRLSSFQANKYKILSRSWKFVFNFCGRLLCFGENLEKYHEILIRLVYFRSRELDFYFTKRERERERAQFVDPLDDESLLVNSFVEGRGLESSLCATS
jgi:hypothetical protein